MKPEVEEQFEIRNVITGRVNTLPKRHELIQAMKDGPIDELLRVAVERPVLDQLEIKVGCALEDRLLPRVTSNNWKDGNLDAVDETGCHQRPV